MYIAIHELLNNCASHYSYCGVDSSDLCTHMLQNDRKEEFLRMTIRKMYDMMNLYQFVTVKILYCKKTHIITHKIRNLDARLFEKSTCRHTNRKYG